MSPPASTEPGLQHEHMALWRRVWDRFWALPAAIMALSLALGLLVPEVERTEVVRLPLVFDGGHEGARSVLSTISSAMISVTGLVFSVTMVVLQLASSQFSPRLLGSFLDSRVAQVTLGVFTGSFLYSLTVLRVVRGDDSGVDGGFVPEVAVTLSYFYVLASVGMFLAFIHHITSRVQVSRVISDLGHATVHGVNISADDTDDDTDDDDGPAGRGARPLYLDDRHGHVVKLDTAGLVAHAVEHGVVVHLEVGIGDSLISGQRIGRVVGADGIASSLDGDQMKAFARSLRLARERQLGNDPLFGTRQLVDIAERALSAGINDPTTGAQVVNELHRVLRALSCRRDPSPVLRDDDGAVRATYRPQTLRRHLHLAVDEMAFYGRDNAQVPQALEAMLEELGVHALPRHRAALHEARQRLADLVE